MKLQLPIPNSDEPIEAFLLYGESTRQLPEWNQDSIFFKSNEKHQITSIQWHPQIANLNHSLNLQTSAFERKYLNTSLTTMNETYLGSSFFLNYNAELTHDQSKIKFGFFHLEEIFKLISSTQKQQNKIKISTPGHLGYEYFFDNIHTIQIGTRIEKSELSETLILNPAIEFHVKEWSANFFTAIKQPSLFQKFDTYSGNPNLKHESLEQITIETHSKLDDNEYQILLFNRKSINGIDYDLINNTYNNIAKSNTLGVEAHLTLPINKLKWEMMSTTQRSTDENNNLIAPEKILNSNWSYNLSSKMQTQISANWNSELKTKNLPSYSIWNWSWQYLDKELESKNIFTIAVNNLTQTKISKNKQYLIEDRIINFHYNCEF
jgi:hypothetical protein